MKSKFFSSFFALLLLILTPYAASAKMTVSGGPYVNLSPTGQVIHLSFANYPTNSGFYVIECVAGENGSRPRWCNAATQLWISKEVGASFAPTADILFKPTSTYSAGNRSVDCYKAKCGIFIRLDHNATYDTSEDQFIPLTFTGTATTATRDTIYVKINGTSVDNKETYKAKYSETLTVVATTRSGAITMLTTTTPTFCSISGMNVNILKGTGTCEIVVTSPGAGQFTGATEKISIKLMKDNQNIIYESKVKPGASITLPALTRFGQKITYSGPSTTNCTLAGNFVVFRKVGACEIRANAPGLTDTYYDLWQTLSFKIR